MRILSCYVALAVLGLALMSPTTAKFVDNRAPAKPAAAPVADAPPPPDAKEAATPGAPSNAPVPLPASNSPGSAPVGAPPRLTFHGTAPSDLAPARGFGKRITMGEAISQVVPKSYRVVFTPAAQAGSLRTVDWSATDNWLDALERVLATGGFFGAIWWEERAVVIADASSIAALDIAPAVRERWELRPSDVNLSAALERWAREAGWSLIWEAERDHQIDVPAVFVGTFDDAIAAVLLAKKSSDYPLQACLHRDAAGNRAARIFRYGERKSCD